MFDLLFNYSADGWLITLVKGMVFLLAAWMVVNVSFYNLDKAKDGILCMVRFSWMEKPKYLVSSIISFIIAIVFTMGLSVLLTQFIPTLHSTPIKFLVAILTPVILVCYLVRTCLTKS